MPSTHRPSTARPSATEDKPVIASLLASPEIAAPQGRAGEEAYLTQARALDGMQKEAIVWPCSTGPAWRLMCDEGPWLNGADLAPFPLAFFTAGLAADFMTGLLAAARKGIDLAGLELKLDNFFTMEGSAIRGTMHAGVDPAHLAFRTETDIPETELTGLARKMLAEHSPGAALLRGSAHSRFDVWLNGDPQDWTGAPAENLKGVEEVDWDDLRTAAGSFGAANPLIRKDTAEPPAGSGPAVGLQAEQKRTVHVHTHARLREDGLKDIRVQCIQPAGSRFAFLSDDPRTPGGGDRAPSGLAYLSAGVAFCFMTQLGRYAQIAKLDLRGYRIQQKTAFGHSGDQGPSAHAVETRVRLESGSSVPANLTLVRMGEQTCYLHAACKQAVPVELAFESN